MNMRKLTTSGAAALASVVLMGLAAGPASAASGTCPNGGTGPAASLSAEQHDAFSAEMAQLKKQRDAIRAKYAGKKLTKARSTTMNKELAAWKVKRDALFTKYGLTPPTGTGLGAGQGLGQGSGKGLRGGNGAGIHR